MKIWKIRYIPSHILNWLSFKRRGVIVGKKTRIYGRVIIKGKGNIRIGDKCLINSSIYADPIGGDSKTNCAIVAQNCIEIHDNVYVGGGCKIYDTDFHSLDSDERINETGTIKTDKIEIMQGAFIGAHSIILKGVTIGEKSIIGAGSVVTKDVPSNEIWAGNPARKVRDL